MGVTNAIEIKKKDTNKKEIFYDQEFKNINVNI